MPAGSFLGSLISSQIANKWSRKYTIQLAGVIWIIGALLQCFSVNVGMLVVGRIIGGSGVGMPSALVPVYQSEIAPKEIRGRIVSLQQWAITWVCYSHIHPLPHRDKFELIETGYLDPIL